MSLTDNIQEREADLHVILRPVRAHGGLRQRGELVRANDWRHRDTLIEARYLRPLYREELTGEPVETTDGRQFLDEASARAAGLRVKRQKQED